MLVRLLKQVEEADRYGNMRLRVNVRRGRPVPYVKDAVIDMSEASAHKYIEKGLAEAYVEPPADAEAKPAA